MLDINLDGLYTGKVNVGKVMDQQASLYESRWNDIWDFLKATDRNTKFYKILHNNYYENEFPKYEEIARKCRGKFKTFVFIGMGGAILNSAMVSKLSKDKDARSKYRFLSSTDPDEVAALLNDINLKHTGFFFLSNTGNTTEVISLFLAFKGLLKQNNLSVKKHCYFITNFNNGALAKIAKEEGATQIEYGVDFGGRFSTFSDSVLFTGMVMGVNMREFNFAYNQYLNQFWKSYKDSDPVRAARATFYLRRRILPLLSYASALEPFLNWNAQIISESIGKEQRGYAPITSVGPQQQHTLFEYFADGTNDHLVTFYNYRKPANDIKTIEFANSSLSMCDLKSVNDRMLKSSAEFLQSKDIPTRIITMNEFNESAFAKLVTFTMLEIVLLSLLHQVHPFLQPQIEDAKKFMLNKYFKAS